MEQEGGRRSNATNDQIRPVGGSIRSPEQMAQIEAENARKLAEAVRLREQRSGAPAPIDTPLPEPSTQSEQKKAGLFAGRGINTDPKSRR